jgi:hypothetical protein
VIPILADLSPALAAAVAAGGIWSWRHRHRNRHDARAQQLREAAALLDAHASSMARFLGADGPDLELKRLLISFSDAMADRETVARFAEWACSARSDAETDRDILETLRTADPDLADEFRTAIMTAAMGASLRWPESAAHFETTFAKLALVAKSDVAIAMTASRLREPTLGTREPLPAMA